MLTAKQIGDLVKLSAEMDRACAHLDLIYEFNPNWDHSHAEEEREIRDKIEQIVAILGYRIEPIKDGAML